MDLWLIRALLFAAILVSGYYVHPFGSNLRLTISFSAALGFIILLAEMRIRKLSLKTLLGAALGSILGIIGASLISIVISRMSFAIGYADLCPASYPDSYGLCGTGFRSQ